MSSPLAWQRLVSLPTLDRRFYQRETEIVARELLGKLLIRPLPEGGAAVRLTEVEAYLGVGDPAAHTYRGRRTPRNETMWGDGGRLYVYFTYGMHHCMNVVTRTPGDPQAVLLRGGVAVAGAELLAQRRGGRSGAAMLDGPAKLCQALAVNRSLDGLELTSGASMWVADDGFRCPDGWVLHGPRVGVGYAGDAAAWPLRLRVELGRPAGAAEAAAARDGAV